MVAKSILLRAGPENFTRVVRCMSINISCVLASTSYATVERSSTRRAWIAAGRAACPKPASACCLRSSAR